MRISVCIDAVFKGHTFTDSLEAIRSVGIDTFEFWSWWDKDLKAIRAAKDELGMNVAAFCTKFVPLVNPSQRGRYLQGLEESLAVATTLGAPALITQTGNDNGYPRDYQRKSLVDGLKACVPHLEKAGVTLLIEPLNLRVDHARNSLFGSDEGDKGDRLSRVLGA